MNTINNKAIIGLITVFMIFSAVIFYSYLTDDSNGKFMDQLSMHQKIEEQDIDSIRMSKVVLINSTFKHIDINLNDDQIQRIIRTFNSSSPLATSWKDSSSPSIVSGIAIRLKNRSEVRIQYDKENIYVTRGEVDYLIVSNQLKQIFEEELMNKENKNI
ncbi:hypothetical protein DNH61_24710 [Paenibacillus sambharensis]|uniref:Uncharacterized protein n=1 Tax=Paenibacillus sambharensis TaxID=1803190 RepID=A0A2W1L195_9BACL|nr:hypothetical protein [Paenibacillus sambharensis]PZD93136.1 hypothetical protein DNH61_24710 [Paenibacillus sambharensis]